ncbi:uncharacterized protein PRCAT00002929001 [Priceomyces carsonii]|uniref:uncharacterized protein n=1 Tax=Priceomyces carsonii TaxID=28549 RepID=UPI002EDA8F7E|nr:unnamed protein product [Priceomyces carsonii]
MLCTNAKDILFETLKSESLKDKRIKLKIIDIMKSENQKWFDIYCYDVPVLHIETTGEETPIKFMHYFDKSKILEQLNK